MKNKRLLSLVLSCVSLIVWLAPTAVALPTGSPVPGNAPVWNVGSPDDPFACMIDEVFVSPNLEVTEGAVRGGQAGAGSFAVPGREAPSLGGADIQEPDGRVDRYIVKTKTGQASDLSQALSGLQYETAKIDTIASVDTPLSTNRLDTRDSLGRDNVLPVLPVQPQIEVLMLDEPMLPSELADLLRSSGAGEVIEYIQPDFELKLSTMDPEGPTEDPEPGEEDSEEEPAPENQPEELEIVLSPEPTVHMQPVLTAVIDSGLDVTHPALVDHLTDGFNVLDGSDVVYDPERAPAYNHGTHVAGLIVKTAQATGADVTVLPIQAFVEGKAHTSDILAAISYAEEAGASIVNCSFGSTAENPALVEAIAGSSMLFVTAAGNARTDLGETPVYPAAYDLPNVISVASLNADSGFSYFSNYSPESVDLAAVGRHVVSTMPKGKNGAMTGTSLAAAQVTAAASAVASLTTGETRLSAEMLKQTLLSAADRLAHLQNKVCDGRRLNLERALCGETDGEILTLSPAEDFDVLGLQLTQSELFELYTAAGDVVKVVAGGYHTLVLKEDGSVWAFGRNDIGQCGVGGFGEPIGLSQVVGLTDIVDIAAGNFHSLALDSDGRVYTWGGNWSGQLGNGLHGYGDFSLVPQEVYLYDYYSAVAAAGDHSMALCNGYNHAWIAGWGDNYSGQLGFDDEYFLTYPRELWTSLGRVRKMSTGSAHTMGLTQEDVVASWGGNGSGQLGQGTEDGRALPDYVLNLENAADIAAGHSHSLAVTADGSVWAWGKNTNNALGMAGGGTVTEPTQVYGLSDIISVSAGASCSMGIDTEGGLWTWGENYEGLLGADAPETQTEPQLYPYLSDVAQVSLGWSHAVALDADGILWVWGNNGYGQLGDIALESTSVPTMVVEAYYPPVAVAWLEAYVYPQSLSIPETDDTMAWVYVTGYDYQGNGVVWYGFSYWLDGEYPGVSIDRQTGAITVTPEASAGPVIVQCSYGILNTTTIFILTGAETGPELTLSEQTLTIPRTGTATATATLYDETGDSVPSMQIAYYLPQSPAGVTINSTGVITVSPGAQAGYVQVQAVWDGSTFETYLYLQYETPDSLTLTISPETLVIPLSGSVTAIAVAQALDTDGLVIPGHNISYTLAGARTGVSISANGVITVNDTALPGEVMVRAMCGDLSTTATLQVTAGAPVSMTLTVAPNTLAIPAEGTVSATALAHVYDADNEELLDQTILYSLPGEPVGMTINESSGQIVATSAAQPGAVIVQAQCGELVASALLMLTAGAEPMLSLDVVTDGTYLVTVKGANLTDFSGRTFTLTYDPAAVTLADFAAQTYEPATAAGTVPGTTLTIVSHIGGVLTFTVDKTIPADYAWSGVMTVLKFVGVADGVTEASLG